MEDFFKALGLSRPVFWYCPNIRSDKTVSYELKHPPDFELAKKSGMGVFFVVNELGDKLNEGMRLRHQENVIRPTACFADFDEGTVEEQFDKLCGSPLVPSAVVKSGRGYHVYWFLKDTGQADVLPWRGLQRGIAEFFGSDHAVSDPARLMRVPGSWHTKGTPVLVSLEKLDPSVRYTMAEIADAFPPSEKANFGPDWTEYLTKTTPEGSRNTAAASVVGGLLRRFNPNEWESKAWPLLQSWNNTQASPPDDVEKLRSTFQSIAKAELGRRRMEQKGVPTWDEEESTPQAEFGDDWANLRFKAKDGDAIFRFTELEQTGPRDLDTLLTVRFQVPGSYPRPYTTRLNLYSSSAKTSLARELQSLGKTPEWRLLLNDACEAVLRHMETNDTSIDLSTVEKKDGTNLFYPFLSEGAANLLFGDGSTGKTYMALRMAVSLATGKPFMGYVPKKTVKTLFVDYEDTEETASYRISQLCKAMYPVDELMVKQNIRYFKPGSSPLCTIVPALRKIVAEHDIGLIFVDSVASACGNEPEKAESASRYYNALQKVGVTSLSIAHVTKSSTESNEQNYAFGSIFWHNLARNTWNLRGEEEIASDEILDICGDKAKQLGLFHKKCNNGAKHRAIPLRIVFASDGSFVRFEDGKIGFWESSLSTPRRILRLLGGKSMTRKEIITEMDGASENTVKQSLRRLQEQGLVWLDGGQGGFWKLKTVK